MKRSIGLLMALFVMMGVEGVAAQRRGPPQQRPGGARRAQMEQRIRGRFDAMVRERLGLTDEQQQRFQEVLAGFREQRLDFVQDEQGARRQLMRLGAEGELTEEQAGEALQGMIRLREEEVRLFREEQEALVGVLSARQLLRFVVMREQLNQRIQSIRAREGRGMGSPQGRGPGVGLGPPGGFPLER